MLSSLVSFCIKENFIWHNKRQGMKWKWEGDNMKWRYKYMIYEVSATFSISV